MCKTVDYSTICCTSKLLSRSGWTSEEPNQQYTWDIKMFLFTQSSCLGCAVALGDAVNLSQMCEKMPSNSSLLLSLSPSLPLSFFVRKCHQTPVSSSYRLPLSLWENAIKFQSPPLTVSFTPSLYTPLSSLSLCLHPPPPPQPVHKLTLTSKRENISSSWWSSPSFHCLLHLFPSSCFLVTVFSVSGSAGTTSVDFFQFVQFAACVHRHTLCISHTESFTQEV